MSLQSQTTAGEDAGLIAKVRQALVMACLEVAAESLDTPHHAERRRFAARTLSTGPPAGLVASFAIAAAADGVTVGTSPDVDVSARVLGVLNAFVDY